MVFDETISNEVHLSRVFDHFIEEGEKPGIVLSFLEQHKKDLKEIVLFSIKSPRWFSVDNIHSFSTDELNRLVELCKPLINKGGIYHEVNCLVWQVFKCDDTPVTVRLAFQPLLKKIQTLNLPHPHSKIFGSDIAITDTVCFASFGINVVDYAISIEAESLEDFTTYVHGLTHSLWYPRMFQADSMKLLDEKHQWIMLSAFTPSLVYYYSVPYLKGLMSILVSDLDREVKMQVCRILNKMNLFDQICSYFKIPKDICNLISNAESFEEISMRLSLSGKYRLFDFVFVAIIAKRGFSFVEKGLRGSRDLFEKFFDVNNLLDDKPNEP